MKLPSWDGFVDRSPPLTDSDSEVSSFQNSNESILNNSDDNASQECGDSSSYNHVHDINHNEVLSYHNVATTWLRVEFILIQHDGYIIYSRDGISGSVRVRVVSF